MADRAPDVSDALDPSLGQDLPGGGPEQSEYRASAPQNSHTREPSGDTQRSAEAGSAESSRAASNTPELNDTESDVANRGHQRHFAPEPPVEPQHTLRSPGVSEAIGCLNEDDALEFAQGLLSVSEVERAEAHFDSCASCRRLLSEAMRAVDPLAATEDGSTPEFALLRPGNVLGERYRILRFHASGGMGEVYEAYDVELGERVALKTISPAAGDRERAVRYLKAEVQLARRVSHPNVCRTFEFGTDDNPLTGAKLHYLTMEFVEGESLCKYLRKHGPLPLSQARQIAEQILRGLGAAHQAGVLHRDLKTDNVLLRSGPKGSHALLSDFGLARALDFEGYGARQSAQGWVGTPDYMAPEQLEGKPLTAASDLYAFGLVFYEMLTGKLPFPRCRHTVALSARLKVTPSPPSRENPAIPPRWDALILRCLAREPGQRFGSADEVLAELIEAPQYSGARPRGELFSVVKYLLAGSCVAGALYGSAAFWLWPTRLTKPALHAARAENSAQLPSKLNPQPSASSPAALTKPDTESEPKPDDEQPEGSAPPSPSPTSAPSGKPGPKAKSPNPTHPRKEPNANDQPVVTVPAPKAAPPPSAPSSSNKPQWEEPPSKRRNSDTQTQAPRAGLNRN